MNRDIKKLIEEKITHKRPETQEDCCELAASVDINLYGTPANDDEILARACYLAEGLFGEAFEEGSEYQRLEWIDMCEVALRKAAGMEKI
jgi:hypothetical protein